MIHDSILDVDDVQTSSNIYDDDDDGQSWSIITTYLAFNYKVSNDRDNFGSVLLGAKRLQFKCYLSNNKLVFFVMLVYAKFFVCTFWRHHKNYLYYVEYQDLEQDNEL